MRLRFTVTQKKKSTRKRGCSPLIQIIKLFVVVQQSADRQGNLLLLRINVNDLSFYFFILGQNVFQLLDAAVCNLRNVDQTVNARDDLSNAPNGMNFRMRTVAVSPTS